MLAVIVDISWLTTAPITTIHQHIRHIIPLHQRSPYSKPLRPLRGAKLPVPLPHQPTWTWGLWGWYHVQKLQRGS